MHLVVNKSITQDAQNDNQISKTIWKRYCLPFYENDPMDKALDSTQAAEDSLKGAIIYGHHDLVKEAVEEGADINQFLRPAHWESKKFVTPLSLAMQ